MQLSVAPAHHLVRRRDGLPRGRIGRLVSLLRRALSGRRDCDLREYQTRARRLRRAPHDPTDASASAGSRARAATAQPPSEAAVRTLEVCVRARPPRATGTMPAEMRLTGGP